jgi:hypothetical protein
MEYNIPKQKPIQMMMKYNRMGINFQENNYVAVPTGLHSK